MIKRIGVLLVCCLFASCASTFNVEPKDEGSNLVIGQLHLEATNFQYLGTATVNGKHFKDIQIKIRELSTGKLLSTKTQGEYGLFYISPTIGSRYQIVEMTYTNIIGGYTAVLVGTPTNVVFDIDKSGVTYLPKVNWKADDKLKSYAMITTEKTSEIDYIFKEKYMDSKWNNYPWTLGHWN